jgi:hypothetical protein
MKLNSVLQTSIASAIVALTLVIACGCGMMPSQHPAGPSPAKLADGLLQICDPAAKPILAMYYLWGELHVPFILYQDGTVIWATDISNTGFCIAHLTDAEKQRVVALADKVTWSERYTASQWTHQPADVVWRTHNGKAQEVSVYGRLPSKADMAESAKTPALFRDLFSKSTPGSLGPPEKVRALVPETFLALYDEISCFNHPDARPWLPEKVQVTPKANNPFGVHDQGIPPPKGLPVALFQEIMRTGQPVELVSATYSHQIIELVADGKSPEIKLTQNGLNGTSTNNWFNLIIPVPGVAELRAQTARVQD